MKEIKNYLHLHMHCWGILEYGPPPHFGDFEEGKWVLSANLYEHLMMNNDVFKPILRPLSSMTEEELIEVLKIKEYNIERDDSINIQKRIVTNSFSHTFTQWYYVIQDDVLPSGTREVILANLSYGENGFSFYKGNDYFRCYVKLMPFLLSKHFDLFGLIEVGLAIDATTLKEKV